MRFDGSRILGDDVATGFIVQGDTMMLKDVIALARRPSGYETASSGIGLGG